MKYYLQRYQLVEHERRTCYQLTYLYLIAIYLVFWVYIQDIMPLWAMSLCVYVLVSRWIIVYHEMFHLYRADQIDWFAQLMPLPFSPLFLSFRELKHNHLKHHRTPAQPQDPDAFHIRGGSIRAFLGALTFMEQSMIRWVLEHGFDRSILMDTFFRASLFVLLAWFFGIDFFYFWLTLRVSFAVNDFVFFHLLHYRHGEYGTYRTPFPIIIVRLGEVLFGKMVVYSVIYHDIHHVYPAIAAKYLSQAQYFVDEIEKEKAIDAETLPVFHRDASQLVASATDD